VELVPKMEIPARDHYLKALLVLAIALTALVASDSYFTFLEDETYIVSAAGLPVRQTLALFQSGQGQHEHPPLSDLLLHFWLPMAGSSRLLLRLPSMVLYLLGLVLLGLSAERFAGRSAFNSLIYLGCIWPFAFHFARMTGWYSFCFFLSAVMTFSYFRYLEKPCCGRLIIFIGTAGLMLYSNYYGWALLSIFALDICARKRAEALRFICCVFGSLALVYFPMWAVFFNELHGYTSTTAGRSIVSPIVNTIYCFYSLMVSESVAPWIWPLSIPAGIAILVSVVAATVLLPRRCRPFLLYFALLFGGMAAIGIMGTKRLLFISGWLLFSFSIALANRKMKTVRKLLILSLLIVALTGWAGVFARRWYAAPHFIEPWAEIADEATVAVEHGQVVVSNSPSFLFYANYALQNHGLLKGAFSPGWVKDPRIATVDTEPRFTGVSTFAPPTVSSVLFVSGVNVSAVDETNRAESWLRTNCFLVSTRKQVRDTGYSLKARFFKDCDQPEYRIVLEQYQCIQPQTGDKQNSPQPQ